MTFMDKLVLFTMIVFSLKDEALLSITSSKTDEIEQFHTLHDIMQAMEHLTVETAMHISDKSLKLDKSVTDLFLSDYVVQAGQ